MFWKGFLLRNEGMERFRTIKYGLFEGDYYILTKNYRNNRGI